MTKMLNTKTCFAYLALLFFYISSIKAQVTIADAFPGCLNNPITVGIPCGGGTSFFGINGSGQMEVTNIDGQMCCGGSSGGSTDSYFEFEVIDISAYSNVTIMVNYSASSTAYEDDDPVNPIFGCTNMAVPDNSHDQIVFMYSLNGGPFIQDLYVHGTTQAAFTGMWNSSTLNGNTLKIRIYASNKSQAESFFFTNFKVKGTPKPISAGPNVDICTGQSANLMGSGSGTWSGGTGTFGNVTMPVTTYTPGLGETGAVPLTFTANASTAGCADNYPPPSDVMIVNITTGPTAELLGGGLLCEGECIDIDVNISGGSGGPYTLSMLIQVSTFPPINFPITIPGFDVSEHITLCLNVSGLIPIVDLATNTIGIPTIAAGLSGTLTLTGISEGGCPGITNNSNITVVLVEKPEGNIAMGEACDDGTGNGTFIFSDLNIEGQILNGNPGVVTLYEDINLTTVITDFYYGPPTTLYGQIENNGCFSDPIPVILNLLPEGDVGNVFLTCNGNNNGCDVCDTDGVPGEDVAISFHFPDGSNYDVEMAYFVNGVQQLYTATLSGPLTTVDFNIDDDASFVLVAVTKQGQCLDNTGLGNQIIINYTLQPDITELPTLESCDQVILPAITGSNLAGNTGYYTGINGTGTFIPVGTVITTSTSIYVFSGSPFCNDQYVININISGVTVFDQPTPVTACAYYILPDISGSNVAGSSMYFTAADGNGAFYMEGDTIFNTTTLYVYDALSNPACLANQPSFLITINTAPNITNQDTSVVCGSYTVPPISGQNLSGNQKYYSGPNGTGMIIMVGTVIDTNKIIYAFDDNGLCQDDEKITILIIPNTIYNNSGDVIACNSYTLPTIGGQNVGNAATYYTMMNGQGLIYNEGTILTSPVSLFIYDTTAMCQNQPFFSVNVAPGPQIFPIADVDECGSYSLPPINGVNLTGNQTYYTGPNGTGVIVVPSTLITDSTILYAYDFNGSCVTQQEVVVNILPVAQSGFPFPVSYCNMGGSSINLFDGLIAPYNSGGSWAEIGTSEFSIANDGTINIPANLQSGTFTFEYTVVSCGVAKTKVDIALVSVPKAGSDNMFQICKGFSGPIDLTQFLLGAGSNNGIWTYNGTPIATPQTANLSILPLGNNILNYTLQNLAPFGSASCADTANIAVMVTNKPSAGQDVQKSACKGSLIDLADLLVGESIAGAFFNSNFSPTFTSLINSSNLPLGMHTYYHILSGSGLCQGDTSKIEIMLSDVLSAGNNVTDTLCNLMPINLTTLIQNANTGGVFKIVQGQGNINGNTLTPLAGNVVISYTVGDSIACPKDEAMLTLSVNSIPTANLTIAVPTICEDDLLNYIVNYTFSQGNRLQFILQTEAEHTANTGTIVYDNIVQQATGNLNLDIDFAMLSYTITDGQLFYLGIKEISKGKCKTNPVPSGYKTFRVFKNKAATINPSICDGDQITVGNQIFNKNKLTGTVTLQSQSGCDSTITVNVTLLPNGKSDLKQTLCEGSSITVGNTIFNDTKLSGVVTLPNAGGNGCDSVINVALILGRKTSNSYNYSTCDLAYSYTIGNQVFNFSKPTGSVLLSIKNAQGCDSTVNVNLTFEPMETDFETYDALCEGVPGTVTILSTTVTGNLSAIIDNQQAITLPGLPTALEVDGGNHAITLTTTDGCKDTINFTIDVGPEPNVALTSIILADGTNQINVTSSDTIYNTFWSPSTGLNCTSCLNPIAEFSGTYTLTYEYADGCVGEQTISVRKEIKKDIIIPNVFSPHGSTGDNDFFGPDKNPEFNATCSIAIYDRWGNVVYTNPLYDFSGIENGWDGSMNNSPVTPGVYIYKIEVLDIELNTTKVYVGDLTVL